LLLARTNPVGSRARDFYAEPMVVYDDFGLQTVFVMDPELIQAVLLDDVESFNKSPTMIACWARGRRGGFDCRRRALAVATPVACLAVSRRGDGASPAIARSAASKFSRFRSLRRSSARRCASIRQV